MDDKEKLIEQFMAISGIDTERSKFYLESAAWNIETAVSSFYEDDNIDEPPPAKIPSSASSTVRGPDMPTVNMNEFDDSSSEEEGQAFYAGGSEHSGQQVLGPSRKKKDVVSILFKSAKDHGAEVVESQGVKGKGKKLTFAGTGYRLGETESDHEVIKGATPAEPPRDVTLRMWKTGFTVDSGPLRAYEDPANHEFLNSVRRGQIPMELVRNARGGEVYINMEDLRNEEYVAKKVNRAAFSGSGHTLGSLAPSVVGQVFNTGKPGGSSGNTVLAASNVTGDLDGTMNSSYEEKAKENLKIDSSQQTTNIQLRLPDGSRLVLKLNHTHTVGDIRQYALTARPNLPSSFAIMTTFPHAELKDDSQSIVEAKLLNAALVIK